MGTNYYHHRSNYSQDASYNFSNFQQSPTKMAAAGQGKSYYNNISNKNKQRKERGQGDKPKEENKNK
eukprot:CAMPEP_0168345342 /NCGR_PEP_ID=MMETSP0213-20121227/17492_1 /TAXON_ID=151035 /ORGANISM="Euplotes harpa, Strain FSP1.4" /LENGTH=66 /DNA_ID=CAMNT_0008353531 /DNA_START=360 /DNA_END=560 /DNA_ORIENTATION=-